MELTNTLPEGVRRGESVPVENDDEALTEGVIERTMAALKERGEPYTEMDDVELRAAARDRLEGL
jgi:hypothetical protein